MSEKRAAPNILLIQADQLAAPALPVYGHRLVQAPNISRLAERSVVFDAAYCNSPICASSRFSMLSGRYPTSIDAFDNGAEFYASIPTLPHYLCTLGYNTILCGKMHFVGPDQLHGYEERLVTDIYPADFSWTPDWAVGPTSVPSGISVRVIQESGPCERSLQIDYDDEVEYHAIQKLYDLARRPEPKPFFLTASFTHPHSPFTAPREFWDMYRHEDIDMPSVPTMALGELDAHSKWLYYSHGRDRYKITDKHIRNARHAYYAMVSYVDAKVGRIMSTLEKTGLADNTIVIFTADHGEMMGERGMWFKQCFYEWSVRVPLLFADPRVPGSRREPKPVSLLDLAPTLLDLASDHKPPQPVDPFDGHNMAKLLRGKDDAWPETVIAEYTDMGVSAPCRMIRRGDYKYMYTHGSPPQLFKLSDDPKELSNLAGKPEYAAIEKDLHDKILSGWNPAEIHKRVLASQRRRMLIRDAAEKSGRFPNWAYEARKGDDQRFVRSGGAKTGVAGTKRLARFPYVEPPGEKE